MRFACLAALLLAACSGGSETGDEFIGLYRANERDGLCVAREGKALKAGLMIYGDRDTNCSLVGRAEVQRDGLVVRPRGDSKCSVEIRLTNGIAQLGPLPQSCAYYCGPGADFSGRELRRMTDAATKVTDFAGDPLC